MVLIIFILFYFILFYFIFFFSYVFIYLCTFSINILFIIHQLLIYNNINDNIKKKIMIMIIITMNIKLLITIINERS